MVTPACWPHEQLLQARPTKGRWKLCLFNRGERGRNTSNCCRPAQDMRPRERARPPVTSCMTSPGSSTENSCESETTRIRSSLQCCNKDRGQPLPGRNAGWSDPACLRRTTSSFAPGHRCQACFLRMWTESTASWSCPADSARKAG